MNHASSLPQLEKEQILLYLLYLMKSGIFVLFLSWTNIVWSTSKLQKNQKIRKSFYDFHLTFKSQIYVDYEAMAQKCSCGELPREMESEVGGRERKRRGGREWFSICPSLSKIKMYLITYIFLLLEHHLHHGKHIK